MDAKSIQLFFRDKLARTSGYEDLDTSPQSNAFDLLIRPHAILAGPVFDFVNYLNIGSSLANAERMSDVQIDNYAANFFVSRRRKNAVTLEIAVYIADGFTEPLEVYTTDSFRTTSGATFNSTQNYVFVPSTLPLVSILGVNYRVAYFSVKSTNATAKVLANEIVGSTLSHPGLVRVVNERESSEPTTTETNAKFVDRTKKSYGTRNLVNNTGFNIAIPDAFPGIMDLYSIGYGDPEMQRDISIQGKAWSFHAGGMSDLYIRTNLKPATFTVTGMKLPNQNAYRFYMKRYKGFDFFGEDKSNPHPGLLYGWEKVQLPDNDYMPNASSLPELPLLFIDYNYLSAINPNNAEDTLTISDVEIEPNTANYKIYVRSIPGKENLRFSIYEQLEIDIYFKRSVGEMATIVLPYFTCDLVEEVQSFVSRPEQVTNCLDTVVKSFLPVEIVSLNIVTQKGYSFDQESVRNTLAELINTWNLPEPISLSTLLQNVPVPVRLAELGRDFQTGSLSEQDTSYERPPSLSLKYSGPTFAELRQHNINGETIHYYSTRHIGMIENFKLSASRRTVRYFVDPSRITFTTE